MGLCFSNKKENTTFKYKLLNEDNSQHLKICNQLIPLLDYNSIYNVNKKYTFLIDVLVNDKIGIDIKKTYAYKSKVSKEVLDQKIKEFWGILIRNKN